MPRRRGALATGLAAAVAVQLAIGGCAAAPPTSGTPSDPGSAPGFPIGAAVDYQLGGAYDPPDGVGIVARDSTEAPAPGVWSICYVNGFQTQPGEEARWVGANADLVLRDGDGEAVRDPAWPDELILDTTTAEHRERIADELGADLERCAAGGFDAVEIDNLDSFTRAEGLTLDGNLALATLYARQAHNLGLLIGQKNAAEHTRQLREQVGFDFAVAEECVEFGECRAYTDVYGGAVIDIEYTAEGPTAAELASICDDPTRPASTVVRDRDLTTPEAAAYVFARC